MKVNTNYLQLGGRYLFAEIAQQVSAYKAEHPEAQLIRLGIGDVTQPLPPAAISAMHRAVDEYADTKTFRGYGPEQGYDFLRNAIVEHDFRFRGISIDVDEIFVSDGAKSDTGNFQELLSADSVVAVTDPVYPVYVDTNTMSGRQISYIPCNEANGFMGDIPYDLDEAAFLDGCGVWGIFCRVIAPLMVPAIATVGIYTFLQCWNELMFATIFNSKEAYRTLPVGVQGLAGQYSTEWGPIGAALAIATLPTLLVYVFLSKKIQDSFIAGAVKG